MTIDFVFFLRLLNIYIFLQESLFLETVEKMMVVSCVSLALEKFLKAGQRFPPPLSPLIPPLSSLSPSKTTKFQMPALSESPKQMKWLTKPHLLPLVVALLLFGALR